MLSLADVLCLAFPQNNNDNFIIGLEQKELCWIGGVPVGPGPSFVLAFEENIAGAAGGSIYTVTYVHAVICSPRIHVHARTCVSCDGVSWLAR